MARQLTSATDLAAYDARVSSHPQGTLWQSLAWKNEQEALGREVRIYATQDGEATALVVIDRTAFGYSAWDIPRGPLAPSREGAAALLADIAEEAKRDRCLSVFASPLSALSSPAGWKRSPRFEQPEATRIVDLSLSEEQLLAQMKSKGRYNIGIATKQGVRVEASDDAAAFMRLHAETAVRDRFRSPAKRQYEAFLANIPGSFLLLAYGPEKASKPIAGLLGVIWGQTGVYYYGASSYAHRALMAPYLLQWDAMKRCKATGATSYDLLGVAPPNVENHPWQRMTRFKEQFGGSLVVYPPEQRLVLRPMAQALLSLKRHIFG